MARSGALSLRQKESSAELTRAPGRVAVRKSDCGLPTDKEKLREMCMERQDTRTRAAENHSIIGSKEEQPGRFASRLSPFTFYSRDSLTAVMANFSVTHLVGERQVRPRFAHIPIRSYRVIALPAKHPNMILGVLLPESHPAAGARLIVDKRYAILDGKIRWIVTALVDVARSFPPGPQPLVGPSGMVFPDVVEESGALRERRGIAPSAEE